MAPKRTRVSADTTLTITQIPVAQLAERVLVVGDPARATQYSELLENPRQIASNREYVSYTGTYRGVEVSIVSHGVGGPGAVLAFEELCRAGVTRIIRSGTAGGLQDEVVDGSLVVATGAVRQDGISDKLVPLAFPAVAEPRIVAALDAAAATTGLDVHRGIVLTGAMFYPMDVLGSDLELWQRAGCVAVEMEVASLLVTASLHGVEAGAILAIDGNPLAATDENMDDYSPFREVVHAAVKGAVTAALDALVA